MVDEKDLAAAMQVQLGASKRISQAFVRDFMEAFCTTLVVKRRVRVEGFGNFYFLGNRILFDSTERYHRYKQTRLKEKGLASRRSEEFIYEEPIIVKP